MTQPHRVVPDGWIELTETSIENIRIGVVPGWRYVNQEGFGEAVIHAPSDGEPQAWSIRRDRILGSPMPAHQHSIDTP